MILLLALFVTAAPAAVLWRDPGRVETVDFSRPAGGAPCPAAPFTFIEESFTGTSAKVLVRDASGSTWQVKGGPEARADAFATRFTGALGYYAESICFLAKGTIDGLHTKLRRAAGFIKTDGTFTWASFERRDPALKFMDKQGWSWSDNPFVKSHELNGLRVLMMLLSNWDNKDARNNWRGSNTGIFVNQAGEHFYFVTDWGQSLGSWMGLRAGEPWSCARFADQTPMLVRGVASGYVLFGYHGQHTRGFNSGITTADVAWLMEYLGRVTDAQMRIGLLASGATTEEQDCFTRQLRARIEQLRKVAGASNSAALR